MDAYQILGVPMEATWEQIEQAFQRRLQQVSRLDGDDGVRAFVAVNAAYTQLRGQPQQALQLYRPNVVSARQTGPAAQNRAYAQPRRTQPVGRHQPPLQLVQHNHHYYPQQMLQAVPEEGINFTQIFLTWGVLMVTLGVMFACLLSPR